MSLCNSKQKYAFVFANPIRADIIQSGFNSAWIILIKFSFLAAARVLSGTTDFAGINAIWDAWSWKVWLVVTARFGVEDDGADDGSLIKWSVSQVQRCSLICAKLPSCPHPQINAMSLRKLSVNSTRSQAEFFLHSEHRSSRPAGLFLTIQQLQQNTCPQDPSTRRRLNSPHASHVVMMPSTPPTGDNEIRPGFRLSGRSRKNICNRTIRVSALNYENKETASSSIVIVGQNTYVYLEVMKMIENMGWRKRFVGKIDERPYYEYGVLVIYTICPECIVCLENF